MSTRFSLSRAVPADADKAHQVMDQVVTLLENIGHEDGWWGDIWHNSTLRKGIRQYRLRIHSVKGGQETVNHLMEFATNLAQSEIPDSFGVSTQKRIYYRDTTKLTRNVFTIYYRSGKTPAKRRVNTQAWYVMKRAVPETYCRNPWYYVDSIPNCLPDKENDVIVAGPYKYYNVAHRNCEKFFTALAHI